MFLALTQFLILLKIKNLFVGYLKTISLFSKNSVNLKGYHKFLKINYSNYIKGVKEKKI